MLEASSPPDADELSKIMARLALLGADTQMEIARRLLRNASGAMYDPNPAERLLEHLCELAKTTNELPINLEISRLPGLRGRDITALLRTLRVAGKIEVVPGETLGKPRTFRILS